MSLYNLINGVNPATFYILPMLGKHPDKYPRFRDCFISETKDEIAVFTRVGCDESAQEDVAKFENYRRVEIDSFDNTYCTFYFAVPEKWKSDLEKILQGKMSEVSKEYQDQVAKVYPLLEDKMKQIWSSK